GAVGAPAVVEADVSALGLLVRRRLQVQRLGRHGPQVHPALELRDDALGQEERQPLPGAWVRAHVLRERAHARIVLRVWLVGEIQEGAGPGKRLAEERHPGVGSPPGALAPLELRARAVEGDGHYAVADALSGPLVTGPGTEVGAGEAAEARPHLGLVVGVDQLHAVAVRKAMVGGVEPLALVQL